ncbi:MAG: response regulator transcription factor [Chloroflexi bacterium]|nr:response regulator transcription factor [Chloroflexota bacterium]
MPMTIMVVDDEPGMVDMLRKILEEGGYAVIDVSGGLEALSVVTRKLPDLILLDVMMPDSHGFEILRDIREISNVPIIMLTVRATEEDKVRGLELGADDYITKPFGRRELISRIRSVFRRSRTDTQSTPSTVAVDSELCIDFNKMEVLARGERVRLRPTEYKLLYHFVNNAGMLLTHEALLTKVWGREYRDDTQLLRLYITYLRKKIERDSAHPCYIINERGLGYRFTEFPR